jgi:hypothetical protein
MNIAIRTAVWARLLVILTLLLPLVFLFLIAGRRPGQGQPSRRRSGQ